jgi:hypothetical protein
VTDIFVTMGRLKITAIEKFGNDVNWQTQVMEISGKTGKLENAGNGKIPIKLLD